MKKTAERYIKIERESRLKLAGLFGCTERHVNAILNGQVDSDLARKIRHTAMTQYAGVPMLNVPECDTIHDTEEDGRPVMRQAFGNGAVLRVYKDNGEATVSDRKGNETERRVCTSIPDLAKLQQYAASLF